MIRWRPTFSVRTLVIAVALLCVYFGAWEITKKYGVREPDQFIYVTTGRLFLEGDIQIHVLEAGSPLPFVVWQNEIELLHKQEHPDYASYRQPTRISRRYYLWMFGWTAQLPFESNIPSNEPRGSRPEPLPRL